MKQLVIFDLDGTLLDTIADLGTATNHALESLSLPTHPIEAYNMMVGNGVRRLVERALPPELRSDLTIERALAAFRNYYDVHCTDLTRPYDGIPELLSELTARKVNIAVTSNKYQDAVSRIIAHYFPDIPFVAVLGNQPGVPVKPDPSIVFAALNLCPTPKDRVLYVGDSAVDMETARRACVESVGVSWGFRPVAELTGAYANHIISDPDEILSIVAVPEP
ncbi:MAG: HAD family hydrolase [Muribaculaceae bacterium]